MERRDEELIAAARRGAVEDRARRRLGLERALAALPPAERAAIDAHVLGEVSYGDLAAELRCSNAVVRQRVSRGLRRLRSAMEEPS